jgi:hypothetical protein
MNQIYTEPYSETQKKIILIVDNDKEIPSDLKDISPDLLLELLAITRKVWNIAIEVKDRDDNNIYENMYSKLMDEKVKEVENDYKKKLEETIRKAKYNESELERYKNEMDRLKTEYEKTISIERTMKRTLENTLQEKDNAMKAFELNINNLIEKAMDTSNKRHIEEIERNNNQFNKLIENMKAMYASDKEKIERDLISSQEKIKELQENIRASQASVIKGAVGQSDFFELIKEYTSWTGIEDTSKTSHAADLRGYIDKVETMFEVKNYTSDVPTKEVVKMIRDMETHSNISYGVFVSMNTGITGKKKPIEFQWTAHGQLCIFVSNLLKHDIEMIFNYIGQCASVAHRFFSLCNNEEKNELESYKDKLLQVKTIITKQISDISEMITAMGHHKKLHMDNLNKHYTEYKLMLEKMKISCNEIVDIVIGTDEVVLEENIVEPDATVSNTSTTSVVEKRKRKKKNEIMNDS